MFALGLAAIGLLAYRAFRRWQAEAYRDLFGALASHVGELGEITSKCCAGLVHEASRAAAARDEESAAVKRSENDGTAASKTSAAKK